MTSSFVETRGGLRREVLCSRREGVVRAFRRRNDAWDEIADRGQHFQVALETIHQPEQVLGAVAQHFGPNRFRDLVVLGSVGTGKTYLAYALVREYIFRGSAPRLISAVELASSDIDDLILPAALLIDDLGVECSTRTSDERLFRLVDQRWELQQQTIITSNLEPEAFIERVGARVFDRLTGPLIVLAGPSRRHEPVPDVDHATIDGRDLADDVVARVRTHVGADPELWARWYAGVIDNGLYEFLDDRTTISEAWQEPALIAIAHDLFGPDADEWLTDSTLESVETRSP